MESTTISADDLRAAANAIIHDSDDGMGVAYRYAGEIWSERIYSTYKHNLAVLLEICEQQEPSDAVTRLLDLCMDGSNEADTKLLRAAKIKTR